MKKILYSFLIFLAILVLQSMMTDGQNVPGQASLINQNVRAEDLSGPYKIVKVVDGDTVDVDVTGKTERVRLIGINTPETVDPRKPVECFGKEASNKAKEVLTGKMVRLEADPTQSNLDKYGRLLRYIFLEDGTDFNEMMISEGYAYEYTYDVPYKYQTQFKAAQKAASDAGKGLWAEGACPIK